MRDEQAILTARRGAKALSPVADSKPARTFGDVVIGRGAALLTASAVEPDTCVLCLPACGLGWAGEGGEINCPAGAALLLNSLTDSAGVAGLYGLEHVVLLPRRLSIARPPRERHGVCVVMPGAEVDAILRLVKGLLAPGVRLSAPQAQLAGRAVVECAMALVGAPFARTSVAERREASLLDRLADHIDGHLAEQLDVSTLCVALACSRSVLYRAAAPVGGISAFVTQRRIATVHARLSDPAEKGTVAALASACGFRQAAGFSRVFKRAFGMTAAEVRRRSVATNARTA